MHCGFYCTCHSIFPNLCHPTLIRKNCSQQRVLAIHVYLKKSHTIFGIMKKLMLIVCTWQFYHLMELKEIKPLLHIHDHINEIRPLNFLMVMDMQEDTSFFSSDDFRFVGILFLRWCLMQTGIFLHWHCGLILYSCVLVFNFYEPCNCHH